MKSLINKNILKLKPYEPGKPIEEVKRELGLRQVIKLASNENPLGSAPLAISGIKRALDKINRYPEGSCFYLKVKLARKLRLRPENLIFGNGSDELIDVIIKTFVGPSEEIVTSQTSFLEYEIISRINGRVVRCAPLKDFKYDLTAIKKRITAKTKVIFIANPNNPTGTYVNKKELDVFLKSIPKNLIVVLDEAYNEFVDVKDFPRSLKYLNKNVIALRTFSKAYGLAGIRLGYAIAKSDFIRYMENARPPFNVNALAQAAGLAALDDHGFLKKSRRTILEGKRFLYRSFSEMRLTYVPSVANFILVNLRLDGRKIFKRLLRKGIIVRDMKQYGLDNFIRVTIGTAQENKRFIQALKKVLYR